MKKFITLVILLFAVVVFIGSCKKETSSSTPEPSCTDGIQNGYETGIDCGGFCPPCIPFPNFAIFMEFDIDGVNKLLTTNDTFFKVPDGGCTTWMHIKPNGDQITLIGCEPFWNIVLPAFFIEDWDNGFVDINYTPANPYIEMEYIMNGTLLKSTYATDQTGSNFIISNVSFDGIFPDYPDYEALIIEGEFHLNLSDVNGNVKVVTNGTYRIRWFGEA